jgi:hypothetical protein
MNEQPQLSDGDITDLLRRRSARPVPQGLAAEILASLASERAQPPVHGRRRPAKRPLLLLAAAALLLVGGTIAAGSGGLRLWPTTLRDAAPSSGPITTTSEGVATSGEMWPQETIEEVRAAQARADAGDPDTTWQVGARADEKDGYSQVQLELVDRFLREVLGWESYRFLEAGQFGDEPVAAGGWFQGIANGQRYIRCAPDQANPLYPDASCATTIGDDRYESVSLDLAQLDRQGRDGIWVVRRWIQERTTHVDPASLAVQAEDELQAILAARVAGSGAEGVLRAQNGGEVPQLYTTASGAEYERVEIELVDGPHWPTGGMVFLARLFADGGATVVEQRITWSPGYGFGVDANSTTENGQPVPLLRTSDDGEVTMSAPSTWYHWLPGKAIDVWFGGLWKPGSNIGASDPSIGLVDPVAYDAWCAGLGGSPLLSAPADAASIAQQVTADPDFESTAPVAASVGGLDAVAMDVALAPGGKACGIGRIVISRWIHELQENPGVRMRLFLVDLPDGMSARTLAITVKAPKDEFNAYLAEAMPIIESIQFRPSTGAASPSQMP